MSQEMANIQTALSSTRDQLQAREEAAEQRRQQLAALQNRALAELQEATANGSVAVEPLPSGLLLRVGGNVLFSTGQANIRSEGQATLDDIAEFLKLYPDYAVRVEGHTDDIPVGPNSQWPTNWELSTARASAAVRYLESRGIEPKRIAVGGYAEHQPLGDNQTREGRAENRRIEIVVVAPPAADASQ
jgi:chemotaxis protein MotB